jgi:hypothetical protein
MQAYQGCKLLSDIGQCPTKFGKCPSKSNFDRTLVRSKRKLSHYKQQGNLLSLCREIAGARDILQKFENLKKQHEWNFNL